MDFNSDQLIQLIVVFIAGGVLFLIASLAPPRIAMWALLLSVPFQYIDSAYGSINMVMTYMIGVAFYMRGQIKYYPYLWLVGIILLAYMLSFTQSYPGTYRYQAFYMLAIVSNFILFYLTYNFVRNSGGYKDMWNILVIMNIAVLIYCILEMIAGVAGLRLFGIDELAIVSRKAERRHLAGPFIATGLTADYLAIQSILCFYALIRTVEKNKRLLWLGLLFGNLALLVATASRGGPTVLLIGLLFFLVLFRREIGVVKISKWLIMGGIVFVIAATVILENTKYNILFERIETTEFEGYVPDTRQGWFVLWDRIIEKPIIGHGPRMRIDIATAASIKGYKMLPFPHSMYLFLIYTLGLVGLFVYMWFFYVLGMQYWRAGVINRAKDPFLRGLPILGFIVLIVILASQVRMEMFRYIRHDYQQYIFMLLAAFLAFSHLAKNSDKGEKIESDPADENPINRRILHHRKA